MPLGCVIVNEYGDGLESNRLACHRPVKGPWQRERRDTHDGHGMPTMCLGMRVKGGNGNLSVP